MLLDVKHMAVGLQTKALATIANEAKSVSAAPWIPLMIEQVLMFTKERGIYLPEHALLCNFNVTCIREYSRRLHRTGVFPATLSLRKIQSSALWRPGNGPF